MSFSKSLTVSFLARLLGSAAVLSAASGLTGCSVMKDMDDMHSSTAKMSTTTQEMDDKMDQMTQMNGKMDQMAQMNGKMDQLTQMNQQMTDMNTKLSQTLDTMSHMSAGVDAMGSTMTQMVGLMQQMTDMNQAMQTMKTSMSTMLTTLSQMNTTMAVMPDMAKSLVTVNQIMTQLNAKMDSMDKQMNQLSTMNGTMTTMSGQIGDMKSQLAGLRKDLGVLNAMNKSLTATNTALGGMQSALDKTNTGLDHMQGTLGGMSTTIGHMDGSISTLAPQAIHGAAEGLRQTAIATMNKGNTLADKFVAAAPFLFAYEYQLVLKGTEQPTQANEDAFRVDSVKDFFMRLSGMYRTAYDGSSVPSMGYFDLLTHDGDKLNIFAIAGALDMVDTDTQAALKHYEAAAKDDPSKRRAYPFYSMWGMIKFALQNKGAIENGDFKDRPELGWAQMVLQNEQWAIYIAQIRENVGGAVALQNIDPDLPNNPKKGTWANIMQFKDVIFDQIVDWTPSTASLNLEQLTDVNNTLGIAVDAKHLLTSLGAKTEINGNLERALSHCRVNDSSDKASYRAQLTKLKDLVADFTR